LKISWIRFEIRVLSYGEVQDNLKFKIVDNLKLPEAMIRLKVLGRLLRLTEGTMRRGLI